MTAPQVYLLAAGRGRRAGGPKAWLERDGVSLLEHHVSFLRSHLPRSPVAVSIQEAWLERCRAIDADVMWVSVDPSLKPLGAFLRLLAAQPISRWSCVYHVDMPLWEGALFDALLARVAAAEANAADAILPEYEGRGGHPVLIAPRAAESLAAMDPETDRLDHWLRGRRVERVPVDFACVLENWNVIP